MELAAECCREILHHVNQAVRDMEDLLVSRGMAPPGTGHGGESACTCVQESAFGVFLSGGLLEVTLESQLVPRELALFHCLPILLGVAEGQPRAWFSSL